MATKINKELSYNLKELWNGYKAFLTENGLDQSADTFKAFLSEIKLSTVHADEIYDYITGKTQKITINFKNRKRHPKRDFAIKKIGVPTLVTSAGVGITVGAVATSGLVGGATVMGIIPVSATPGLTFLATSTVGAVAGLIATPAIILTKNALVKQYYKSVYKTAYQNIEELNNGTKLQDLKITDLMKKIDKTSHTILSMNQGNTFSKILKFVPKHILNTINRNRIHHLEKCTQSMLKIYMEKSEDLTVAKIEGDQTAIKELSNYKSNIEKLMNSVNTFVKKNSAEAKLNAILTCKENGKHEHAPTIENVDIFAKLKIKVDGQIDNKAQTAIKTKIKNVKAVNTTAREIVNDEKGIFDRLLSTEKLIARTVISDDTVSVQTHDGETVEFKVEEIDTSKTINSIDKTNKGVVVTYTDDSTSTIVKPRKADKKEIISNETIFKLLNDEEYKKALIKKNLAYTDKTDGTKHNYSSEETIETLSNMLESWLGTTEKNKFEQQSLSPEQLKLYKYLVKRTADSINKSYEQPAEISVSD